MQINPFIFRDYDIRGIAGVDLDTAKVEVLGKAYGTFLKKKKIRKAVVGHDCRLSGEEYQNAFIKGLVATGVDVIDLGVIMTQMMYYAQYRFQANGGVMITASHNPYNFNGFKLGIGFSQTTGPKEIQEIRRIVEAEQFLSAEELGKVSWANITEDYYQDVIKRVRIKNKFKVVIDSRHGTTGLYLPEILKRVGCEVIGRNTEIDGSFPKGTPDPTDEVFMLQLGKVVLQENADLGLAYDGDGDRIGVVDEKGRILWNDIVVAIFAQEILERFPGSKIIHNTLCSQVVTQVVQQNGGIPIMWLTGHAFIKSKIAEENAAFGGELSGHFFFKDNAYGHDDGTYAVLRVLEYHSEKKASLSQLYETFPKYISSPEIKIGCPDEKKAKVIKDISTNFQKDFPDNKVTNDKIIPGDDGVRIDFNDGMIIFRYSQNGPYITIKFEAKDKETYELRRAYVKGTLKKYPEMIWQDQLCVNLNHLEK